MFQINSTWIHKNYKTTQGRKPKFSNSQILDKKEKSIGSIF